MVSAGARSTLLVRRLAEVALPNASPEGLGLKVVVRFGFPSPCKRLRLAKRKVEDCRGGEPGEGGWR